MALVRAHRKYSDGDHSVNIGKEKGWSYPNIEGLRIMQVFMGIDGGGTHTRVVLMDSEEVELGRVEGSATGLDRSSASASVEEIGILCRRVLDENPGDFSVDLCAGLAGAGDSVVKKSLKRGIDKLGLVQEVSIRTDAEVAFMDAFGPEEPGILLIAGTGSTALGRGGSDSRRVGGWGSVIGDEGSGYRIGLESLRSVIKAQDGRKPASPLVTEVLAAVGVNNPRDLVTWVGSAQKSQVAALAGLVCHMANEGEKISSAIVEKAVDELVLHVRTLVGRLGSWKSAPRVVLHGGLIDPAGPLHDDLIVALEQMDCVIFEGEVDGARGACKMAKYIQFAESDDSNMGIFP